MGMMALFISDCLTCPGVVPGKILVVPNAIPYKALVRLSSRARFSPVSQRTPTASFVGTIP